MSRFYATTRQATGDPYRFHAYVRDRETGRVVQSCEHDHRTTRDRKTGHMRTGQGARAAEACAQKMLRRVRHILREGV